MELEGHSDHSRSECNTPYANPNANANAGVCAPRAEQLSEMFRSFRSGKACSLPTLRLPPYDDNDAGSAFEGFIYSEIFGGFDLPDFAVSFENLFLPNQGHSSPPPPPPHHARTPVGTEPLPEDGDVCETTDTKFNVSCHKVNPGEDSNPIHVAQLRAVIGNSCIYDHEGSMLQKEDEETYGSGVPDDIILRVDSSGTIFVETQSQTNPSILSHGSDTKAGSSRPPPTALDTKKDPASSVSDFERPKGNAAKALFDIGSLDFLNVQFDAGSSATASAEAVKEAMDRAKVKLESARESTERKKDDAKGTRPVMNNDMKAGGKGRMVCEESVSRNDELQREHCLFKISRKCMQGVSEVSQVFPDHLQAENTLNVAAKCPQRMITKNSSEYPMVDEESRKREKEGNETKLKEAEKRTVSAHDLATKCLKLERSNTNKIEDEVAEQEMERNMQVSESEYFEKMCEDSAINEEHKIEKGCLHAELKNTDQNNYEGRYFDVELDYSTFSIWPSTVDETNNEVPEMTCESEDLKSSNLAARVVEKNIKSTAVACGDDDTLKDNATESMLVDDEKGEFRSGTFLGELESKVAEMKDICMSTKHLQMTEADQPMMTEKEREGKLEKLHHKRHVQMRERERENDLDKNRVSKIEVERQREREKELKKERLRKLVKEREQERERKKDSIGVELTTSAAHERASAETQEGADRAAVETAAAEARQRAMAEARERLEKACAEARGKSFSEKSYTEARLRAERAAVLRANAEAREHAIEKAMAERATFEAREQVERSASEKFSSPLGDMKLRHNSSTSDLWSSDRSDEVEGESTQSRSRLERHCRTVERVAKVLAEKNMRDLDAQKEEAEKNRLAESLDADIKRWSSGKEGNLRALLSTLQYILGPNSGWHPIPLTEVISSAAVKKAYRKATLCVHPDKLQQRGATIQQKYICEKVFDLLKDSWNRFSSEER